MAKSATTIKPKANKKEAGHTEKSVSAAAEMAKEIGVSADDLIPPEQVEPEVQDKPAGELVVQPQRETALSIVGGVSTEELKQALTVQTEQRALIQQFIKDNLAEGIDYGRIHVVRSCPAEERQRGSCDKDYHFSKSILFKPGQEKIFSLFGITDTLTKDEEAYAMLGNVPGLVAYKCEMFRGDKKVGEGRGAATLGGTQNDPNSTIKKAEKRARMDGCLSLGFSAYFTQDLDDPEYASQREMMNSKAAAEAERRDRDEFGLLPRDPAAPIDTQERQVLYRMTVQAGFVGDEILELLTLNGISDPANMTSGQARDMMAKLKNNAFAAPVRAVPDPDVVIEDIDDEDPAAGLDAAEKALDSEPEPVRIEEAELVIDDDLKSNTEQLFESLGLNNRGTMWFMKAVAGKPFAKFDKFTDHDWRKAYETIMAIMDQKMDVADEYIAGVEPGPIDYSAPKSEQLDLESVQKAIPGAEVLND